MYKLLVSIVTGLSFLVASVNISAKKPHTYIEKSVQTTAKVESKGAEIWPMAQVRAIPSVSGLWQTPINGGQCFEKYNFTSDNKVFIESADERIIGRYLLQPVQSGKVSNLEMRFEFDNAQKDCDGKNIDQTGEVMRMTVITTPNNQQMRWCEIGNLRNCFLDLEKVLP